MTRLRLRWPDIALLLLALVAAMLCGLVCAGCGNVTAAADADAGRTVEGGDDVGRDVEPEHTPQGGAGGNGAAAGAAGSAATGGGAPGGAGGGAGSGATCSWDCRAFCDCGALPCCRATGAADCCTR